MPLLGWVTLVVWALSLVGWWALLHTRGVLARLQRLLGALLLTGAACLLSVVLVMGRMVQAFVSETLIARVKTRPRAESTFELTYTPAGQGAAAPLTVTLAGTQWALSGGLIKWHPWLTALGVPSYHAPRALSGQFADLERQRRQPPTVYPLAPGTDWLWELAYRLDPLLPFVEAVYGSSAYAYAEPGVTQEVYVTPSGYLIKRAGF